MIYFQHKLKQTDDSISLIWNLNTKHIIKKKDMQDLMKNVEDIGSEYQYFDVGKEYGNQTEHVYNDQKIQTT